MIKCIVQPPPAPSPTKELVDLPPEDQVPDVKHFLSHILSEYSHDEEFAFDGCSVSELELCTPDGYRLRHNTTVAKLAQIEVVLVCRKGYSDSDAY